MEIYICDYAIGKEIIKELEELSSTGKAHKSCIFKSEAENMFTHEYSFEENSIHIYNYSDEKLKIEFYENKPPHLRLILSDQMDLLFKKLNSIFNLKVSKLLKHSWFSVLWTPLKVSKQQLNATSFLVYYNFNQEDYNNFYSEYENYNEIPLIGILPIKLDEKLWLKKISKCKNLNMHFFRSSKFLIFLSKLSFFKNISLFFLFRNMSIGISLF